MWVEIMPIFRKDALSERGIWRGIRLKPVVTGVLPVLILLRFTAAHGAPIRVEQAGFWPAGARNFTLRQVLEQNRAFLPPTTLMFLEFKGAFDSVEWSVCITHTCPTRQPSRRDWLLPWCDGFCTSLIHWAILEGDLVPLIEPLMQGWSTNRGQTNSVSWSSRLGVGTRVSRSSVENGTT